MEQISFAIEEFFVGNHHTLVRRLGYVNVEQLIIPVITLAGNPISCEHKIRIRC